MSLYPTLNTERLILRQPVLDDAPTLQRLIDNRTIAETTLNIPYPYEDGMAEDWIARVRERFDKGIGVNFAIILRETGEFIGGSGMGIERDHDRAKIGYWIGHPYWENGYATEAIRAVVDYGFRELGLNRIYAWHMTRNPASGRVMQKIGMKFEGLHRQHVMKWGEYEDENFYGILRDEWEK